MLGRLESLCVCFLVCSLALPFFSLLRSHGPTIVQSPLDAIQRSGPLHRSSVLGRSGTLPLANYAARSLLRSANLTIAAYSAPALTRSGTWRSLCYPGTSLFNRSVTPAVGRSGVSPLRLSAAQQLWSSAGLPIGHSGALGFPSHPRSGVATGHSRARPSRALGHI